MPAFTTHRPDARATFLHVTVKFRSLFIDAPDPAAGLPIDGLATGLNLVLTGDADMASFLRTFIWGVLFGYGEHSTGSVPDGVGGRLLELARDNGSSLIVARYRDARAPGAEIVWVSGDGVRGGEELLAELLRGVGPGLYRDVHAIVIGELPSLAYDLPDEPEDSPESEETVTESGDEPAPQIVDSAAEWSGHLGATTGRREKRPARCSLGLSRCLESGGRSPAPDGRVAPSAVHAARRHEPLRESRACRFGTGVGDRGRR